MNFLENSDPSLALDALNEMGAHWTLGKTCRSVNARLVSLLASRQRTQKREMEEAREQAAREELEVVTGLNLGVAEAARKKQKAPHERHYIPDLYNSKRAKTSQEKGGEEVQQTLLDMKRAMQETPKQQYEGVPGAAQTFVRSAYQVGPSY